LKRSNRLVLLVGIFLAVVAFVLIAIMLGGNDPGDGTPTPATTTTIVVAARDVERGALITAADLETKTVPIAERPALSITDTSVAIGQTARARVTAGQLMTTTIWSPEPGLVRVLDVPPGKVGVSVRVDQTSGVGTVIQTGDYVDAIIAFSIQPVLIDEETGQPTALGEGIDAGPSVKALLQGMQVLGTLLPPPPTNAEGVPQAPAGTTVLNGQEQIVILAVDLQQAEVLNYAQLEGVVAPNGITLALRSLQDFQDAAGEPTQAPNIVTTGMILSILVEQYGVLVPDFGVVELPEASPAP
jgi:Flp pilus assembly protein CpaB